MASVLSATSKHFLQPPHGNGHLPGNKNKNDNLPSLPCLPSRRPIDTVFISTSIMFQTAGQSLVSKLAVGDKPVKPSTQVLVDYWLEVETDRSWLPSATVCGPSLLTNSRPVPSIPFCASISQPHRAKAENCPFSLGLVPLIEALVLDLGKRRRPWVQWGLWGVCGAVVVSPQIWVCLLPLHRELASPRIAAIWQRKSGPCNSWPS